MKDLIVPGTRVADSPQHMPGTFIDHGATYTSTLALFREGKVIPLKGTYLPQAGDYVIGVVKEERFSGYLVDLHSPYDGSFSNREIREEFKIGDVISASIVDVNEVHEATLSDPRKFMGGDVLEVSAVKVPRIIGRNGSMLETIKRHTGTELFVGKNGRIYLRGGNIALATHALLMIDREAHRQGLTDRMTAFLENAPK